MARAPRSALTTLRPKKARLYGTTDGRRDRRSGGSDTRLDGRLGGLSNDYRRAAYSSLLTGGRRHTLHPRTYYQPHYGRYRYCQPYRHYHIRRHFHRRNYCYDWYRPYYGYFGLGYYPRYGHYYGIDYSYPGYGYYGLGYYYPTSYGSYTTVYRPDPFVGSFDDEDVYYTNNIYIGAETEEGTSGQSGSVAFISTPQSPTVERTIGSPIEPTVQPSIEVGPAEPPDEGGPSDTAEPTLVDFGNAAFNAGEYNEAVRYYVGAVLADDKDAVARLFYGLAQFALGDYDLAAMGMRRALAVMPDLIDRPIDLRSLYPDIETFESHLDKLVRFVNEHPSGTNALFVLGYVYYASAQPELAVPTLRALTDLDPKDELASRVRDAAIRVQSTDEAGQ